MKGTLKIKKDRKGIYLMITRYLKKRKTVEFVYGKVNKIYKEIEKLVNQGYILI